MASSSKQRKRGFVPVKEEAFDLICISSDDEGDNGANRFGKRVTGRVEKMAGRNAAKRVEKMAERDAAKRVEEMALKNAAKRVDKRDGKTVARTVVSEMKEILAWTTPVTKAMQKLKGKQTLHIHSFVVRHALLGKTEIYMRSAETKRTYDCAILNPGRSFQRYIGDGWYDYVDLHKPKVGDILQFSLKPPYNLIVVSLVRGKPRYR